MHNDENLINDKSDNFGIYMATKYYEDDTDLFAYKENIINGKDKWNVDTYSYPGYYEWRIQNQYGRRIEFVDGKYKQISWYH